MMSEKKEQYVNKNRFLIGVLLFSMIFTFTPLPGMNKAEAHIITPTIQPPTGPGVVPFGGLIWFTRGCSTSCGHVPGTLLIQVGPPVPAWVMYVPGISTLYPFHSLRPGSWILGIYYPGTASICYRRVSGWCIPTGWAWGNINIAGTSL